MKTTLITMIAAASLASGLSACGAASSGALPPGSAPSAQEQAPAPAPAAPKATTCDKAREAILTGTPAQIVTAMKALVADRSADATAREYARYYLVRDAGDKQLREMDVSLIQSACSI